MSTFSIVGEPLPKDFDISRCTYVSRDFLCRYLRELAATDSPDIESLGCNAVNALLAYIADPEITHLFNRVPAL